MAWTTPRTWTDGELVTASIMNAHVRDNLNATSPHLVARLTSDQTQANGVFANSALALTVGASEIWHIKAFLIFDGSNHASCSWTFPASGTCRITMHGTNSGGTLSMFEWTDTTSPAANVTMDGTGNAMHVITGVYINGGTSGTLAFYFAGSGGSTTLKTNSILYASKLA